MNVCQRCSNVLRMVAYDEAGDAIDKYMKIGGLNALEALS